MSERRTASDPTCEVVIERRGDYGSIALYGVLAADCADRVESGLRPDSQPGPCYVILDLRGLTGSEPEHLALLLEAWAGPRDDGIELILARLPKRLRPVIEETGLDASLPIAFNGGPPTEPPA